MLEKSDRNSLPFMMVFHGDESHGIESVKNHQTNPSCAGLVRFEVQNMYFFCPNRKNFVNLKVIKHAQGPKRNKRFELQSAQKLLLEKKHRKKQKFHEVSLSMWDWVALPLKTFISFVVLVVPESIS